MIQDLLWAVVIIAAAWSQYAIIDKSKRNPIHLLWFGIRVGVFALFLWWYWAADYYIVWAAPFMVATFAFWFPTLLNKFRGKMATYLSDRGYDKVMKWIFRHQEIAWWFWLMMFIIFELMHLFYNHLEPTAFNELW